MKAAVIFYHKNIQQIYKPRWVEKCVASILNQSYQEFDIYELNYGNTDYSIIPSTQDHRKHFFKCDLLDYSYAMNFILDKVFDNGYDAAFNTNLDDNYHLDRFKLQIECIQNGIDLVSSDFCYIRDMGEEDVIFHYMNIHKKGDIRRNLLKDHNVIAHPAVGYSKRFWEGNRYGHEVPREDLDLWKSAIQKGYSFYIIPQILLYYRIHEQQVSNPNK